MADQRAGGEFEAVDISVTGTSKDQVWVSAASRLGTVHGVPRPVAISQIDEHVENFRDSVKYAVRTPPRAEEYGRFLHDLVFGVPELAALFQRTRGAASDGGRPLLVRLMTVPHRVAALPWELILDPEQGPHRHLTLAPDAHVVRLARIRTSPVRTSIISPPLRMLLILSSPLPGDKSPNKDLMFDLYEEKRALLAELEELVGKGLLQVDVEDRPTIASLRSRIARQQRGYNIIHYIGHGKPETLLLEDERGVEARVKSEMFNTLLSSCPDLRLIFFGACQSAETADDEDTPAWPGVLSLADRCVRDASPVVIGMQALLPFPTERLLTRFFYQGLTSGRTIADAMTLARAAVYNDEHVGDGLLDWAVPRVVIGGESPGRLLDTSANIKPVQRKRREELKLDLVEGDREFFARYVPLRQTVDFLAGRTMTRALWVVGPKGVGKTRLIDRAMEDTGEDVDYNLYISVKKLKPGTDLVQHLCDRVVELLVRRSDFPKLDSKLKGGELWQRIVEQIVYQRIAIVIDDLDHIDPSLCEDVGNAIGRLVQRRTKARLVLAAEQPRPDLLKEVRDTSFGHVKLFHLTWAEVWQWIRRNRPVLTRYAEPDLEKFFGSLGERLEGWSDLANRVAALPRDESPDLTPFVEEIVAEKRVRSPVPAQPADKQRGEMPTDSSLRVAVAGPFTENRQTEFATALTRLATSYGVAGRIVAGEGTEAIAPVATLLPLPSPFANGQSSDSEIIQWLERALQLRANIVLADFGSPAEQPLYREIFTTLKKRGVLVIGCGSNDVRPTYPGWLPQVLAVGPLDDTGRIASYSYWDKRNRKPDLFAPEHVRDTPLEAVVTDPEVRGASLAALHVVAAAVLVWATNPHMTPDQVRSILLDSAQAVLDEKGAPMTGPRRLDVAAAVRRVKEALLKESLQMGPLELQGLSAASGLSPTDVLDLVPGLQQAGVVRIAADHRVQAFELNPTG